MALCSGDSKSFIYKEEGGNKKLPSPSSSVFHLLTKSGYLLTHNSLPPPARPPPSITVTRRKGDRHKMFTSLIIYAES